MNFPKDNEGLFSMYSHAEHPEPEDLVRINEHTQGRREYHIDMIKGLPSLRRFHHRKIFFPVLLAYHDHLKELNLPTHDAGGQKYKVVGLNVLCEGKRWGRFGICKSPFNSLMIDYFVEMNGYVTSHIRDYIRRVQQDVYLGQFWMRVYGTYHHLGWFSMERSKDTLARVRYSESVNPSPLLPASLGDT